jgi:hypothetical protein
MRGPKFVVVFIPKESDGQHSFDNKHEAEILAGILGRALDDSPYEGAQIKIIPAERIDP